MKKKWALTICTPLIVAGMLLILFESNGIAAPKSEKKVDEVKSRFEKLELFNKVLFLIEGQYYRKINTESLISGAIKGMMDTLDPHSSFLSKKIFMRMQEDTQGEFGGLGIEVTQIDGTIMIITPIEDTPAFRAGIKPGDKIVEINNESIIGITLEEAVEKMKGKSGTKINIGIVRKGVKGIKHFEIVREIIKIKPVKSSLIDSSYIFIRLIQFQKRSAKEIIKAIKTLRKKANKIAKKSKKKGSKVAPAVKGIILDLRSNPGGLLEEAVDVSSIFLKDGVVVSTEGRDGRNKEIRYVKKSGHKELKLPMVVLINASSASASEIVAGALQDSKRAIIMGTNSFGKGSVQTVSKIDKENGIKLTIAQYLTPKGKKIQAIGIKPDIRLYEFDEKWIEEHRKESAATREKDLRNHLTATIETEEEKRVRIKHEKEEREARIKLIETRKREKKTNGGDGKKTEILKKYDPQQDYQVVQAVNYLKSFSVFKKMQ